MNDDMKAHLVHRSTTEALQGDFSKVGDDLRRTIKGRRPTTSVRDPI